MRLDHEDLGPIWAVLESVPVKDLGDATSHLSLKALDLRLFGAFPFNVSVNFSNLSDVFVANRVLVPNLLCDNLWVKTLDFGHEVPHHVVAVLNDPRVVGEQHE